MDDEVDDLELTTFVFDSRLLFTDSATLAKAREEELEETDEAREEDLLVCERGGVEPRL